MGGIRNKDLERLKKEKRRVVRNKQMFPNFKQSHKLSITIRTS